MSEPTAADLFDSVQDLEDAAERRYLDNEFTLGAPTYPELPFEVKVRLRKEVIRLRTAAWLGAREAREITREVMEDRTRDAAGLE